MRLSWTPPVAGAIAAVRYHHPIGSEDLIERLRIERSLLVVPAHHFELDGFLRIGFGAEPEVLTESLAIISDMLATVAAETAVAA